VNNTRNRNENQYRRVLVTALVRQTCDQGQLREANIERKERKIRQTAHEFAVSRLEAKERRTWDDRRTPMPDRL
jgi:hypothetical protein